MYVPLLPMQKMVFSDQCIEFLSEFAVIVAPFIENLATRRLARNLLETYIGPRTGRRILEGQIQRGDGEEIKAAIWFSDFRNFTQYTENISLGANVGNVE